MCNICFIPVRTPQHNCDTYYFKMSVTPSNKYLSPLMIQTKHSSYIDCTRTFSALFRVQSTIHFPLIVLWGLKHKYLMSTNIWRADIVFIWLHEPYFSFWTVVILRPALLQEYKLLKQGCWSHKSACLFTLWRTAFKKNRPINIMDFW